LPDSEAYQRGLKLQQHTQVNALIAWLREHMPCDIDVAWLESFDISAYLKQTAALDIQAAERIRRLCIFLEEESYGDLPAKDPRSWQAMQRVYDEARKLDPENAAILVSNAISALHFADCVEDEEKAVAFYEVAKNLLTQALELDADNPHALYTMGLCEYDRPDGNGRAGIALRWFERACRNAPGDAWAQLYRAHCLHDMEEWDTAVAAYEAVDRAAFVGPVAWRAHKLVEQIALCRLHAGDRSGALKEFHEALRFYSALTEQEFDQCPYPIELLEAACGPLRDELSAEVMELAKRHEWHFAIERLKETARS
jgi:tetratricopeptide (TPR) repeat protein